MWCEKSRQFCYSPPTAHHYTHKPGAWRRDGGTIAGRQLHYYSVCQTELHLFHCMHLCCHGVGAVARFTGTAHWLWRAGSVHLAMSAPRLRRSHRLSSQITSIVPTAGSKSAAGTVDSEPDVPQPRCKRQRKEAAGQAGRQPPAAAAPAAEPSTGPSRIYERELWQQGHARVAGVDEAGRGPLAGPVVAAGAPEGSSHPAATPPCFACTEQVKGNPTCPSCSMHHSRARAHRRHR